MLALAALGSTLALFGPTAWRVLAHRVQHAAGTSAVVDLERVGFRQHPPWLVGDLLLAVLRDLRPRLGGRVGLLEEGAAKRLAEALEASPWVEQATFDRLFPDRLLAELRLRRPVLEVRVGPGAALQALVDEAGIVLPPVEGAGVPRTILQDGTATLTSIRAGAKHPDQRVLAAAAVAVEWRDHVAPAVADVPALVEVDAANLGYRFLSEGQYAEVRVGLARRDGGIALFGYGHPPQSPAPRVPAATIAHVLSSVLREYPGLVGIERGDLRFVNRWRDWLHPREPRGR